MPRAYEGLPAAVPQEEDPRAETVDRRAEAEVVVHLQGGEADVHPEAVRPGS